MDENFFWSSYSGAFRGPGYGRKRRSKWTTVPLEVGGRIEIVEIDEYGCFRKPLFTADRPAPVEPPAAAVSKRRLRELLSFTRRLDPGLPETKLDPMTSLHKAYRKVDKSPPWVAVADVDERELEVMRYLAAQELAGA